MEVLNSRNCLACFFCDHQSGIATDNERWTVAHCVRYAPTPIHWLGDGRKPDDHDTRWSFPRVGKNLICGAFCFSETNHSKAVEQGAL